MEKKWQHRRDDGGSMFATVVTIVIGSGLCCFVCLVDGTGSGDTLLGLVLGVTVSLLSGVVWLRYGRRSSSNLAFWNAAARNHNDDGLAAQYLSLIHI